MKSLIIASMLITTAALSVPNSARSDDDRGRNAVERLGDHRDLRQDRRQLHDDLRDAAFLDGLIERHQRAAAAGDRAELLDLQATVATMLAAEFAEAGAESAQARHEVRTDRREVRADRREIREDRGGEAGTRERRDDRHDLRGDRRDRRDDRRDAEREVLRRERYAALQVRWSSLDPVADAAQQSEILGELRRLAAAEVRADKAEGVEDRRELREDRRESREDRRER